MHASVEIFDSVEQIAEKFAGELIAGINSRRGSFYLAISGGKTPQTYLAKLAEPDRRTAAPWDKLQVFFTDERAVGPDHPDSNYGMVRRAWLDCGAVPEGQVHRMQGEAQNLAREAERYGELISNIVPEGPSYFPMFDLIVLGMGEDGHVASLFPGTKALDETMRLVEANHVPRLGGDRLTLTFPVLNAAREVWLIVCGEGKARAVARALRAAPSLSDPLPVMLLHPAHGKLRWWLDGPAAKLFLAEAQGSAE